jgi:hypothetical protein
MLLSRPIVHVGRHRRCTIELHLIFAQILSLSHPFVVKSIQALLQLRKALIEGCLLLLETFNNVCKILVLRLDLLGLGELTGITKGHVMLVAMP